MLSVILVKIVTIRSYHLMVYLRLGWLTVLSSRNMVEHELYFRLTGPGWCWSSHACTHVQFTHTYTFIHRDRSIHTSISISVHTRTSPKARWQPWNVGHLKAHKLIQSVHCQGLTWLHTVQGWHLWWNTSLQKSQTSIWPWTSFFSLSQMEQLTLK